ncbi:MAG TPA: response regulator [Pyrinomonadaceae bacterium]|jgi:CheY-like chemotaxis protein|nr:response regulator [Pyrinomonadaceae bacterium]
MIDKEPNDLTILLVEDSDDARYFMRLELEHCGYSVIEAADGMKAVELAFQEHPDIILMDLSLPNMDGLEATKRIRENEELKKVPIIAVTAHQESTFRQGAAASGFDAYVTKPVDMNFLSELISGLRFIE